MFGIVLLALLAVALVGVLGPPVLIVSAVASGALLALMCALVLFTFIYLVIRVALTMLVTKIFEVVKEMWMTR